MANVQFLLESLSFEDKIGHLYRVDIEFNVEKATKGQFAYNETYPSLIENKKQLTLVKDQFFNYLSSLSWDI